MHLSSIHRTTTTTTTPRKITTTTTTTTMTREIGQTPFSIYSSTKFERKVNDHWVGLKSRPTLNSGKSDWATRRDEKVLPTRRQVGKRVCQAT
ncbi:hypothetical protein M0802_009229 [Mischocyttarus mexicanus]|nr:hypothetical protein M0802_009229 [Mischocyttarus mexicanus]